MPCSIPGTAKIEYTVKRTCLSALGYVEPLTSYEAAFGSNNLGLWRERKMNPEQEARKTPHEIGNRFLCFGIFEDKLDFLGKTLGQ